MAATVIVTEFDCDVVVLHADRGGEPRRFKGNDSFHLRTLLRDR